MLQLTEPSGLRLCLPCPLMLQLVAFAYRLYWCVWSESWFNTDGDLCVCSEVWARFMWGRCVLSSDTLVRHSLKRKYLQNAEQGSWPPTKEKSLMQWKKTLISEYHILCFQAAELWSEQVMTRTNIYFESHIPSLRYVLHCLSRTCSTTAVWERADEEPQKLWLSIKIN